MGKHRTDRAVLSLRWCPLFFWVVLSVLAMADFAGLWREHLALAGIFAAYLALAIFFIAVGIFVSRLDGAEPWIPPMLYVLGVSTACFVLTLLFSYVAVGWGYPLADPLLLKADAALHFNWLAFYKWAVAHPLIHQLFIISYVSLFPQIVVAEVVLVLSCPPSRAWEFLGLFVICCLGCILPSFLWPAIGAFDAFHVELQTPYLREIAALHQGVLGTIGKGGLQGVIEFPSFHTAMGVVIAYAMRGLRGWFPAFLVLNALMIVSTLPIGGHYLADVMAGIVVALLTILVVREGAKRGLFEPMKAPSTGRRPVR